MHPEAYLKDASLQETIAILLCTGDLDESQAAFIATGRMPAVSSQPQQSMARPKHQGSRIPAELRQRLQSILGAW